jgi:hypothetical protein
MIAYASPNSRRLLVCCLRDERSSAPYVTREAVAHADVAGALAAMRAHGRDMVAFLGDTAQAARAGRTDAQD